MSFSKFATAIGFISSYVSGYITPQTSELFDLTSLFRKHETLAEHIELPLNIHHKPKEQREMLNDLGEYL